MFKWLRIFSDYKKLLEYTNSLEKELKKYRSEYTNYVTVPVPSGDTIERFKTYLADLGANQFFRFYLLTIENDLMAAFRDGKEADIYRGGLKVVHKIRTDMNLEMRNQETRKKNAEI